MQIQAAQICPDRTCAKQSQDSNLNYWFVGRHGNDPCSLAYQTSVETSLLPPIEFLVGPEDTRKIVMGSHLTCCHRRLGLAVPKPMTASLQKTLATRTRVIYVAPDRIERSRLIEPWVPKDSNLLPPVFQTGAHPYELGTHVYCVPAT